MPPKPLQSIKPSARVAIDREALRRRPALAVLVAYAITDWARVEANLGQALILLLGAEAKPAAAMYGSLKSPQAKAETFLAVARMVLSAEMVETFEAVFIHLNKVAGIRNKLAHGLWAMSDDIPEALLLVDAKHELARSREMADIVWNKVELIDEDRFKPPGIHPKDVFVYCKKDLEDVISQVAECFSLTQLLGSLAGLHAVGKKYSEAERVKIGFAESHDRIYNLLRSELPLQKILNKTKKVRPDGS